MFIQQSVTHEKDKYIKGTYVVSSNDGQYREELRKNNKRIGFVNFYYDVAENKLSFDLQYCQDYVSRNYQELVETVWYKIRLIKSFWSSNDYEFRSRVLDNQ